MKSDTLIFLWILVIPISIIESSNSRTWFFYFISVPYTITELQAPETHKYIPRGAKKKKKKNVHFSSSKFEQRQSAET
jgi:hypothetical protein